ncbi:E3 ubiquitin-protein ligase TRIM9-like [Babylonia areolata]|uniref:E3 ubiquitin-protein ligase TRIM9-like n=1 Tax=Babylonia areolata TaxID=304850 RepID=UPI003FD3D177
MSGHNPPPHVKAASEDLSYLRMEEDLTCPVCLELYADPLMLPCSHSVCKKCLADILISRTKASKEGLECPSCRNQHSMSEDRVDKLPRNLALENIVFRFQELQSSTISKSKSLDLSATPPTSLDLSNIELPVFAEEASEEFPCGICEEGKEGAAWYCHQCSVLYCQKCLDSYHPKRGSLQQHRLSRPMKGECDAREPAGRCGDHAGEATSIYCWGCQVLVCHLCVCEGTGRHAGHKILDLDTAWAQVKESLGGYRNRLESMITVTEERRLMTEQLIQEIDSVHTSSQEKVVLQYDRMIQDVTSILSTHKAAALRHLQSLHSARLAACNTHAAVIASQSQQLHNLMLRCKDLLQEDRRRHVLQCCGEAPPLGSQVTELETQHAELASTHKHLCGDREALSKMRYSLTEFRASAFDLLQKVAGDATEKCVVITPTIRSMMLTSPGKSDSSSSLESQSPSPSPRAGNRTLISWGFNSTTFNAEFLTQSAQWTVTVEKNTSKIGNINSGYLFGVGVAHDTLSSKDQVGLTATSAGIVCSNGCLAFCRDGKMESLLSLDQLPVSVTVCVTMAGDSGVIFSYLLSLSGWSRCLLGKAVLPEPGFRSRLFPVFTVSQRVKMQFPSSSNV